MEWYEHLIGIIAIIFCIKIIFLYLLTISILHVGVTKDNYKDNYLEKAINSIKSQEKLSDKES